MMQAARAKPDMVWTATRDAPAAHTEGAIRDRRLGRRSTGTVPVLVQKWARARGSRVSKSRSPPDVIQPDAGRHAAARNQHPGRIPKPTPAVPGSGGRRRKATARSRGWRETARKPRCRPPPHRTANDWCRITRNLVLPHRLLVACVRLWLAGSLFVNLDASCYRIVPIDAEECQDRAA